MYHFVIMFLAVELRRAALVSPPERSPCHLDSVALLGALQ